MIFDDGLLIIVIMVSGRVRRLWNAQFHLLPPPSHLTTTPLGQNNFCDDIDANNDVIIEED